MNLVRTLIVGLAAAALTSCGDPAADTPAAPPPTVSEAEWKTEASTAYETATRLYGAWSAAIEAEAAQRAVQCRDPAARPACLSTPRETATADAAFSDFEQYVSTTFTELAGKAPNTSTKDDAEWLRDRWLASVRQRARNVWPTAMEAEASRLLIEVRSPDAGTAAAAGLRLDQLSQSLRTEMGLARATFSAYGDTH